MKKVVVLGANFAGLTAALELARKLKKVRNSVSLTVISPSNKFLYVPSLIWVPFGKRKVEDITFDLEPVLKKKKIEFMQDKGLTIDPSAKTVTTEKNGEVAFDYLVVATGVSMNFKTIKGFDKHLTECIVTPKMALHTYEKFKEFLNDPGPIVVGATQGASCMGAAYEYLFNLEKELRKHNVRKQVELTWISPEPFLGHFGIGGIMGGEKMLKIFMKMFKINWILNSEIEEVFKDKIVLKSGKVLPYKMSMLIPPFEGADVVKNSPEISDAKGFIECTEAYHHVKYTNIFAAGLAVQVPPPFKNCEVAFGVPKTGFPSDVQGKIVAHNIAREITGEGKEKSKAFGKIPGICIMDAGGKEVLILTNHLFKPRTFEIMLPNVVFNIGKRFLEKYMLVKNRWGLAFLP